MVTYLGRLDVRAVQIIRDTVGAPVSGHLTAITWSKIANSDELRRISVILVTYSELEE